MEITTKKVSDYEIEFTKQEVKPEPIKVTYKRSFIEQQIKDIQRSKDEFDSLRDKEIAECTQILSEMDKLNITLEPVAIEPAIKEPIITEETLVI